jgi:hypothetical protein
MMTLRPMVTLRILLVLGLALALFFPSFFGDDGYNYISQTEVATVTSFLENTAPGPVYVPIDDAPLADTARYDLFPITDIFGTAGVTGGAPVTSGIANALASFALSRTGGRTPAYVLVTPGMLAYAKAYDETTPGNFAVLLTALAHSRAWKLIVNRSGTVIYELPPTSAPSLNSAASYLGRFIL